MADASVRSNIALLKARSRGIPYIPARAMNNTLVDPAKLMLIIPNGKTWSRETGQLRPILFQPGIAYTKPVLVELPPPQAPKGLLVADEKGTANAIPSWIDGFAAVPFRSTYVRDDQALLQDLVSKAFTWGRAVWKGDEEIMRTFYLGDSQRQEVAFADQSSIATDKGGFGTFQSACGAPGQPVYRTPGYVYTGRASADFYLETVIDIANASGQDLVIALYVYGQFMLNVDPMQTGTADAVRGGTFGASAGDCSPNAVNALEGTFNRMPPPQTAVQRKSSIRCG